MLIQTDKSKKIPTLKFESTDKTFSNGAKVILYITVDKENPENMIVEPTKATVPFNDVLLELEYKPWVKACIEMASKWFQQCGHVLNIFREKQRVPRIG